MVSLPRYDLETRRGRVAWQARLARLRQTVSASGPQAATVAGVLDDVRRHGDKALVRYMRRWTDPDFTAARIAVAPREIQAAQRALPRQLRKALCASIEHVRAYQQHIRPHDAQALTLDGARLGLRFSPVQSVGLTVPGGKAVLFSSLIMLAVPALVAGVEPARIRVVNPPPDRRAGEPARDISPLVLGTCGLLGLDQVYRIGGAQAVAALAYGTPSVGKVDLIAGPGNVFVQLAKAQVLGVVGTDNGFYGPSEVVTIADGSADPRRVAADLIAQAEHDPGKCFLIGWSRPVLAGIVAEVERQKAGRPRLAAIDRALATESAALLVRDEDQAVALADTLAAEHVNLAVRRPRELLARLAHGGEFFLGDQTPVAAGDYYAGPSHCLPTGTTARFASGVSVYTFLRRSGTVEYPRGMASRTIEDIALLAEAEGLTAHADSARARGRRRGETGVPKRSGPHPTLSQGERGPDRPSPILGQPRQKESL
jgi:histidinol dehydrogenase